MELQDAHTAALTPARGRRRGDQLHETTAAISTKRRAMSAHDASTHAAKALKIIAALVLAWLGASSYYAHAKVEQGKTAAVQALKSNQAYRHAHADVKS